MSEAPPDITASWQPVPYSKAKLSEAVEEVTSIDGTVWAVQYLTDYSGIRVTYEPHSDTVTARRSRGRVAGVPTIYIVRNEPLFVDTDGRGNGNEPFHGGSRIERPNAGRCSTAVKAERSGGDMVMLTAHHCNGEDGVDNSGGVEGIPWSLDGDGTNYGMSGGVKSQRWDVQALDNQTYTRDIWMGGIGDDAYRKTVTVGAGHLAQGELVRVSGGFSGDQLTQVNDPDFPRWRFCDNGNNPFCGWHYNFVQLRDYGEDGDPILGQGDSGGPAVQYVDYNNLKFAGVISAGNQAYETANCPGLGPPSRRCFSRGLISPWELFKGALNLTLPG